MNLLETFLQHPEIHASEMFGVSPWSKQREIIRSLATRRETNVPSCHSAGKSFTAALATLMYATRHVNSVVVTTAPTDRQVREIVWREIHTLLANARVPIGGRVLTQKIEFGPEWWVVGFTADDTKPDSFQGIHAKSGHVLVVLDEACGITQGIYEAARSLASGEHGRILAIANPTNPLCEFRRSCDLHGSIPISAYDTPNFTAFDITEADIADGSWKQLKGNDPYPMPYLCNPEWVESMYHRWGPGSPMYDSRVCGRFPTSSEWAVVPLEWAQRSVPPVLEGRSVWGLDVARSGANETVIARRLGNQVSILWSGHTPETTEIPNIVDRLLRSDDPAEIRVDADGVGGPVYDMLRQKYRGRKGLHIVPIHGSSSPSDPTRFENKRAENWWNLRELLERYAIGLDQSDDTLLLELSSVKYAIPRGKILIESKEQIRRRGVLSAGTGSPDRADAVILACAPRGQTLVIR